MGVFSTFWAGWGILSKYLAIKWHPKRHPLLTNFFLNQLKVSCRKYTIFDKVKEYNSGILAPSKLCTTSQKFAQPCFYRQKKPLVDAYEACGRID